MADDIDMAQTEIDWTQRITVQTVINKHDRLEAQGRCYYCETRLRKKGQLFCDEHCAEDFERIRWAERMAAI